VGHLSSSCAFLNQTKPGSKASPLGRNRLTVLLSSAADDT
jgi:hypothetical protein